VHNSPCHRIRSTFVLNASIECGVGSAVTVVASPSILRLKTYTSAHAIESKSTFVLRAAIGCEVDIAMTVVALSSISGLRTYTSAHTVKSSDTLICRDLCG